MEKNRAQTVIHQINSQGSIILEGAISVMGVLDSDGSRISKIILKQGIENHSAQKLLSAARAKNIETIIFNPDEMAEFEAGANKSGFCALGKSHGGVFAVAAKRKFLSPEKLLGALPKDKKYISIAVIEGIEDPYNLGYAARALYTQGIDALILPERDFGFSEATVEKASTGTFSKMPAAVFSNDKTGLAELLKESGFTIYCINKKAPANSELKPTDIFEVKFADWAVFIIGGEKRGISGDFLQNADEIVKISYANAFSHSLAAQSAATIVAYELRRQRIAGKH
jgi:23S rRNA (guanosine2251-2'-O)-methyltransferase